MENLLTDNNRASQATQLPKSLRDMLLFQFFKIKTAKCLKITTLVALLAIEQTQAAPRGAPLARLYRYRLQQ
ncbi:hypothetical protein [Vreelandella sp. V005]|uniref:hypothetical protein n=1 Tax=Vreelandella sp. V005 TaxID=3459608 RepID=UPI0040449EDF